MFVYIYLQCFQEFINLSPFSNYLIHESYVVECGLGLGFIIILVLKILKYDRYPLFFFFSFLNKIDGIKCSR